MAAQREPAYYLIDGYNVINAWPELIRLRSNLDEARDVLIRILTEYGAFENYEMTVVFDAFATDEEEHALEISSRMRVIYTATGETADSCIERLAYTAVRMGREVHVVTSDGAEPYPRGRRVSHYLTRAAAFGKKGKKIDACGVHQYAHETARAHRGARTDRSCNTGAARRTAA